MSKPRSALTGRNGGKTKAWRRTRRQFNEEAGAKIRYGRKFRDAMTSFRSHRASGYPLLNGLMAWGGWIQLKKPAIIDSDSETQPA